MKNISKLMYVSGFTLVLGVVGCGGEENAAITANPSKPDAGPKIGLVKPDPVKSAPVEPEAVNDEPDTDGPSLIGNNTTVPSGNSPIDIEKKPVVAIEEQEQLVPNLPNWALRKLKRSFFDQSHVAPAFEANRLFSNYATNKKAMDSLAWNKGWISYKKWYYSGVAEKDILKNLLSLGSDIEFQNAMKEFGIELYVLEDSYVVTPEALEDLRGLYATNQEQLVKELNLARNAVQMGVQVELQDVSINNVDQFDAQVAVMFPELTWKN